MSAKQDSAKQALDEIVCDGVAVDVFHADLSFQLLGTLDSYVKPINKTGTGKHFFANLQLVLDRHLYLGLSRTYEPYSDRNPGRSIDAAVHLISLHASDLTISDSKHLRDFLILRGYSDEVEASESDEGLSMVLLSCLKEMLPRPDRDSTRPLDIALCNLKNIRDKAIAHRDHVDSANLLVPQWQDLGKLIDLARDFVVLIARSYLNVHHDLEGDVRKVTSSFRRLLNSAGLEPMSDA